jgi:hypothetical protein
MLNNDVVSNHATPDIGSRSPRTLKHFTQVYRCRQHLYTIPTFGATSMADDRTRSALDYQHKWLGRRTRAEVHHAKLVATRLIKLDIGGELA